MLRECVIWHEWGWAHACTWKDLPEPPASGLLPIIHCVTGFQGWIKREYLETPN
jgi:hypothetical protein